MSFIRKNLLLKTSALFRVDIGNMKAKLDESTTGISK
jgi:hypothetical protein